ncbi:MAG: 50S ribosomal protein L29 [candidate division Zixibacteria bacterium]|nr:50S ribosomal protein L29 [candidate division Zixibacteria bacterium]
MKSEQIRDMTSDEILQRKAEIEEELFNLKLLRSTKELSNPLKLRTLHRDLARIKTILREDEMGLRKLSQVKREPTVTKREEKDKA